MRFEKFLGIPNDTNPNENRFRKIKIKISSDDMQCVETIMQYIIFMINMINERNLGPRHDTVEYLSKTFEKFDPDLTGTITIQGTY